MLLKKLFVIPALLLSLNLGGTIGCGAKHAIEPLTPAGFIDWRATDKSDKDVVTDRTPFSYYWADSNHPMLKWIRTGANYELFIPAVRREFLTSNSDSGETLEERGEAVANYLHEKVINAIKKQAEENKQVTLVDQPTNTSLTLEIALTKLETGNPLAYAAGFAAPVPGVATTLDALGTASLAMEVKLYDSANGSLLVEFADKRIPRVRPIIDMNKFTKTRPLYDIATDWATEIAKLTITNIDTDKLEGTSNFSLLPW